MKYVKKFKNEQYIRSYIQSNWISPHLYLNKTNKLLDYEEKYTPVQYIRSTQTGGQYIDLGIGLFDVSPINFEIDMNFMIYGHGKTGTQQSTILCASKEESPYPGLNIRILSNNNGRLECSYKEAQNIPAEYTNSNKYYMRIYDINGDWITDGSWEANVKDCRNRLIHFDYEFNFTDNQLHNITTTLFCSKNSSGTPWRFIDARIDYCKLYKNKILIRDFIPVVKNKIPGLYDKVYKKFYRSQGTEDFVAGPRI